MWWLGRTLHFGPAHKTLLRFSTTVFWREGDHDDLVLAAAMAAWKAQQKVPKPRIRLIQL
jgi:hypothetical protein